ncbi:AGAP008071-PA-like protein [Anopheles sinensis]|uniref:AGAP008071-PA-like protein n=1 Tax=Anopheles sinensis TaxID=74873 RepID=A0A084VN99_ANOSI|nr:AGAP008071-PA-like protein [Anopheles sinensis]
MPNFTFSGNSYLSVHKRQAALSVDDFNVLDFFLTYDETTAWLQALQAAYPDRVVVESIGASVEERDIYSITINPNQEQTVIITANVHAREWVAMTSAIYIIHELVRNPDSYPELTQFKWIIVPMPNPDGYEYSRLENRYWRKNRSPQAGGTVGVDLNRNFEFQWDVFIKNEDIDPTEETYRGPSAGSEPETKALANLILLNNAAVLYLDMHSYGQYIFYPWGYTDDPAPNVQKAKDVAAAGAEAISYSRHENYRVGTPGELLYKASGSAMDFCHSVGIRACISIELTKEGFEFNTNQIIPYGMEALAAVGAMAETAARP